MNRVYKKQLAGLVSIIFIALLLSSLLSGCAGVATLVGCTLDPPIEPVPSKKVGNFDIFISYEYRGLVTELKDQGRCTYAGRGCDGRGLYNEWEFTLKSGSDKLRPMGINTDLKLYFPTGGCQRLMTQDFDSAQARVGVDPHRGPVSEWRPWETEGKIDALNIRLIRYEISKKP